MNLIGEKPISTAAVEQLTSGRRLSCYFTAMAFPIFVVLTYGPILGQLTPLVGLLISTILYFAAIYFFYGIAELAFERHTYLLWSSAVAAFVLGFLAAGLTDIWSVLTGCSMFLFGGVIVGRMCRDGHSPGRTYLIGAAVVALFFTAQLFSYGDPMMDQTSKEVPRVLAEMDPIYRSLGSTEETTQDVLTQAGKLFALLVRLIPAFTVLGVLVEFGLGFLVFAWVVNRRHPWRGFWAPFSRWRVPFAFTPVVAVTILARLLGNETAQLVADNILAVLALYYCIAGLALIEYYMNKLSLPPLLRFSFYMLLFLTQFVSLLAATAAFGTMTLLGFVDSFADWRKEPSTTEAAQERNRLQ